MAMKSYDNSAKKRRKNFDSIADEVFGIKPSSSSGSSIPGRVGGSSTAGRTGGSSAAPRRNFDSIADEIFGITSKPQQEQTAAEPMTPARRTVPRTKYNELPGAERDRITQGAERLAKKNMAEIVSNIGVPKADLKSQLQAAGFDYDRMANYNLEAAQAEMDELKKSLEEARSPERKAADTAAAREAALDAIRAGDIKRGVEAVRGTMPGEESPGEKATKEKIDVLERDYNLAKYVQNQNKYNSIRKNTDFDQYAKQGAAIENPSLTDGVNKKGSIKNKVAFGRENHDQLASMIDGNVPEAAYFMYKHMTDDEVATYNYILAKEGEESADEYLEHMQEALNYRMGKVQADAIEDKTVLEILYGGLAGLDNWTTGARQAFTKGALPTSATQYASEMVRGNLSDVGPRLPDWLGGNSLGQMGYDVSSTIGNMAPSILAGAVTGSDTVGAATMGVSAGGSAYGEALKQGYTKQQATNYGILTGISEGALSKGLSGISNLGGSLTKNVVKRTVSNINNAALRAAADIGINMASEGMEEYLQTVLEPGIRNLTLGEDNEVKLVSEEAAYSFFMGALTSGLLESGPAFARSRAESAARGQNTGDEAQTPGQEAQTAPPEAQSTTAAGIPAPQAQATENTANRPQNLTPRRAAFNDSGAPVEVTGVSAVENGKLYLTTAEGGTVSREDISFDDPVTDLLYENAAKYGAEGAASYIKGYDGSRSLTEYSKGFDAVYNSAKNGFTYDEAVNNSLFAQNYLTQDARQYAYGAGQNARGAAGSVKTPVATRSVANNTTYNEPGVKRLTNAKLSRDEEAQIEALDIVFKSLGRTVEIVDTIDVDDGSGNVQRSGADAMFNPATNVYTIAAKGVSNAYSYFATHESVHDIKANNADGYSKLESIVLDFLKSNGEDVDGLVSYQERLAVAARGEDFMRQHFPTKEALAAYAREEVIANTVPVILSDPETGRLFAERFLQEDEQTRTAFGKLLDDIVAFMRKAFDALTGKTSWKQMKSLEGDIEAISQIRDAYFDALEGIKQGSKAQGKDGERYSISYDTENRPFVVVEEDILAGVPKNQWIKTVKKTLADKFPNGVRVGNNVIKINAHSRKEMTYSEYTKWLSRNDDKLYADKFKSTAYADEIILASRDYIAEGINHARKDNIKDFARGSVQLRVDSIDYNADVIVGTTASGEMLLYDIINLQRTQIEEKSRHTERPTKKEGHRSGISATDKVSQNDASVNTSILKTEENSALRFSLRDTADADVEKVEERDSTYQDATENIEARAEMVKGHKATDKGLEGISAKILKDYSSHYDAGALKENLREIFDYASTKEKPSWKEIMWAGTTVTKAVIKESSNLDKSVHESYKDTRAYLRGTRIALTAEQQKEAAELMGSYGNYRMSMFGSVNLANSGMPLTEAWEILSQKAPELFNPNAAEMDMPSALLNAVNAMRPAYTNPYGFDMDAAAYDAFLQICDMYFDLPEVKANASDGSKLLKLKAESARNRAQIRKNSKDKFDQKLTELRKEAIAERAEISRQYAQAKAKGNKVDAARFREQYRRLTDLANIDKLMKQKAAFQEWKVSDRAKRHEREDKRKYMGRIEKTVKEITTWLTRPTDAKHVPESLRKPVFELISVIDLAGNKQTQKAQMFRDKLEKLGKAMDDIERAQGDEDYSGFYADFDPDLRAKIQDFLAKTGEKVTVNDLNAAQLKELSEIMAAVKKGIVDANKLLANSRYQHVAEIGEGTMQELAKIRKDKAHVAGFQRVDDFLNLSQLDSFSFFDKLGPAAWTILSELREGQDKKIVKVRAAADFMQGLLKGVDTSTWTGPKAKLHTFEVKGGKFKMTAAQIMDLYNLNKRGQAQNHIFGVERVVNGETEVVGGGIRIEEARIKRAILTVLARDPDVILVTREDVNNIIKTLTPQQKKIADAMQKYVNEDVAGWGNEASLQMYGYKKFTEPDYWPIRTNSNNTRSNNADGGKPGQKNTAGDLNAIKNMGMTKQTVKGARNSIMIGDIFDVFTRHVDDMATYNAFLVPLSDAMKWYNYQARDERSSVKHSIERAYGAGAKNYFITFIRDLNGSGSQSQDLSLLQGMMGGAKVAAVGANPRVVLQQFSAYFRAMDVISPKYLLAGLKNKPSKSNIAQVHKYCPIAQWKSWGFFDTNIGRSMRGIIINDQTGVEKLREGSVALAGKADEITWTLLWGACEAEIKDTRKDLKPGSEAFNIAVGKRLSEVVDRTQVVDSVFHRSQFMRNKDLGSQTLTAFMSEPTKTYNMLRNAAVDVLVNKDAKSVGKLARRVVRTAITYTITNAATAALASIADAFRDDDENETWGEKYWQAFEQNFLSFMNPLNLIPLVKEVVSLLEGYTPSRLDTQVLQRVVYAGQAWVKYFQGKSSKTEYELIYQSVQALSSLRGLPAGNLLRSAESIYRTVIKAFEQDED